MTLKMGIASLLSGIAGQARAAELQGKKIIVVGAGIAGLAAAQRLKNLGASVIVLEAENYVGGRIRTDISMGAPFEYGAGWIHGPSHKNPVKNLATQVNAATFVTNDDSLEVFNPQGHPLDDADYDRLDRHYTTLQRNLNRNPQRWGDQSIYEMIQQTDPDMLNDPMAQWMLSAYIEFEMGSDIGNVSAANANGDEAFAGKDQILLEGYASILAPLKNGLDIRLNAAVSQISIHDNGVLVDGHRADYVVCTVPLGVLKAGSIGFEPPLPPDMQNAIDEIGFGTVTKIAFKFDQAFWDLETQYFGIVTTPSDRWSYWLNYRTFSDENILLGFSFGDYAAIADSMSQQAMTIDALEVLRSVWGAEVPNPSAVLTTHWSQSPNFRGAYSFPQAGGSMAQFAHFETPVAGRIFMAGEHTDFRYHSTTHGALLSGWRAAEKIADL